MNMNEYVSFLDVWFVTNVWKTKCSHWQICWNSPSWVQPGFGHKSRSWAEGAAADRRWRDTTHMRCWLLNGGATGRSMWSRVPLGRSCSNRGRAARSRGESRARSLRRRSRLSWSLRCQPSRSTAQWCNAHRRGWTRTPGTQSLNEQEERRQKTS